MGTTISGEFETRRDAEMTIERLVQEFGIDRTMIFVEAAGDANTAGSKPAGSDTEAGAPTPHSRDDAALNGAVAVSVDLADEGEAQRVRAAFRELGASGIVAG